MATISHEPSRAFEEKPRWATLIRVPQMWASLAIVVMWLSVLFDAVWGPDVVSTTTTTATTIPSAVFVAPFAFFGTWVVARHGFRHEPTE